MSLWVTNGFGRHLAHTGFLHSAPSSPIVHPAPGPIANFFLKCFFPLNPFPCVQTSSCPTSPRSSSSFHLVFNTHLKPSICLPFTNLFLPASVFPFSSVAFEVSSTSILSLSLSVAAFVSQSPSLSISISLCLSASCESVLVLTGLAMGCSAKCSGALGQNI